MKYTPVVGPAVQEEFNKEVRRKPRALAFIPGIFKKQEMCNGAVRNMSHTLLFVPVHFRTQEMFERVVGL